MSDVIVPPYSSVLFHMLDRETGVTKSFMAYPVTRIELMEFTGSGIKTTRIFIATAPDPAHVEVSRWEEQQ